MATASAGRKARPSHLKLAEGRSPGRDSGGRVVKPAPPFLRQPPPKPTTLSPTASRMWDEITSDQTAINTMKALDGFALEALCESYARWHDSKQRRLEGGMLAKNSQGVVISPLLRIEVEASREFRAWCAEFGLTPAAEVKIASTQEAGGDGDLF